VTTNIQKIFQDELISSLKTLGLSTNEGKIFIVLTSYPQLTATELCRETGIPDSKIYYALDGLLRKGMIVVQQGRPNVYRALPPSEAMNNLKDMLKEELAKKIKLADEVSVKLSPLFEGVRRSDEIELAYIIRGWRNITCKMNELIRSSKEEITLFIPETSILHATERTLLDAKERGLTVNLALTSKIKDLEKYRRVATTLRLLRCPLCLLICDMHTLLTIPNWNVQNCSAIITQDQNLITMSREYFENPKCCTKI
jgi:sugar-specific transcriptional regulator TrmB